MKNKSLLRGGVLFAITFIVGSISPFSARAANGNCGFDTTIVQQMGVFYTPVGNATYQWLYCATGLPVTGATGQSYTPAFGGSYAVAISLSGCTDTTECLQSQSIIATGINDDQESLQLKITTVPNGNFLSIRNNGIAIDATIILMNFNGQVALQQQSHLDKEHQINTESLASGWYVIQVVSGNKSFKSHFFKSL